MCHRASVDDREFCGETACLTHASGARADRPDPLAQSESDNAFPDCLDGAYRVYPEALRKAPPRDETQPPGAVRGIDRIHARRGDPDEDLAGIRCGDRGVGDPDDARVAESAELCCSHEASWASYR
jgi:hypothetical protein